MIAPTTALAEVAALLLTSTLALGGPPFAKHAEGRKSLVVPEAHPRLGTVYHALTGQSPQIHFNSDAPLEDIKGQSNRVIGYAVRSGDDLLAGEWHVPVESLKTGIPLRDEHLASKAWLDAESHPHIVFQLARTVDPKLVREGEGFRTYVATLIGDMTVHGVTREMKIPGATIVFMAGSDKTDKLAKGDLIAIRAKYDIALADSEVSHQAVRNGKVAQTIEIDMRLYLATVPPEQQ